MIIGFTPNSKAFIAFQALEEEIVVIGSFFGAIIWVMSSWSMLSRLRLARIGDKGDHRLLLKGLFYCTVD